MHILFPILILGAIGLIAGLGLAIASKVMAVPVNEKESAVRGQLPGANCGACGFSGCDGYAKALADGTCTDTALCAPGGQAVASAVSGVLGVEAGEAIPKTAMVLCQGCTENTDTRMIYSGVKSCRMASQLFGGPGACVYGCIGFGDCVSACEYGALGVYNGVAKINASLCRACGKCVSACPKGLIELTPFGKPAAFVLCKNKDKGAATRKACTAGCIGCKKCEKLCEVNAVTVSHNVAVIDYTRCTACGKCAEGCPQHSIRLRAPALESAVIS